MAALLSAGPAAAICPDGPCVPPDPGSSQKLITHTITVAHPAEGIVTSAPAGISCGSDCTAQDGQIVDCIGEVCDAPDPDLWQTFTLTASGGRAGFAPQWTGCVAQSDGTCTAKADADRTVGLTWRDVQGPSVTMAAPAAGSAVGASMTVSGTASDNDRVASVEFLVDGVRKATDTAAPYSAVIAMGAYGDGTTHSVTFRAIDPVGRFAQITRSVTVDRHVTLTVGTVPAFTNAAAVPLTIATEPDATMRCRLDGGALTPCGGTYSPVSASTSDGGHTYEVVATDGVGNTASATRTFVLDRTAPAISGFDGPPEGGQVTTSSITISFSVADANLLSVRCQLDGQAPRACTGATSDVLSGMSAGTHRFTLVATDRAGNQTTKGRTFSVAAPAGTTTTGGGTTTSGGGTTAGGSGTSGGDDAAAPQPRHRAKRRKNSARLRYRVKARRRSTRFTTLQLRHVARHSTIRVTCKGGKRRGCRRHTRVIRHKHGTVKLRRLTLRPGAKLTVRVTTRGRRAYEVTLTVRRGHKPRRT